MLLTGGALPLPAQTRALGRLKDFKWADLRDVAAGGAEATNRLKTLITGTEAVPQGEGMVWVKEVRIESYAADGRTNLVTEAPECLVHQTAREARSAGPLKVLTGDGRFFTEGQGFLCRLTNYSLTISNAVRTVIRQLPDRPLAGLSLARSLGAGGTGPSEPSAFDTPLTVTARRLEFDGLANRVRYTEEVQADHPQLRVQAETLQLLLDTNNAIREILAERNVRLTSPQDGSQARANRALYTAGAGQEQLQLLGNASWTDGWRSGRAETMTFDPQLDTLVARQDAVFTLPRTAVQQLQPQPGSAPAASPPARSAPGASNAPAPEVIEVHAATLTFHVPSARDPHRRILAQTNVVILSPADRSRATGSEARYDEKDGTLTLAGHAEWQDDQRLMRAERLEYQSTNRCFRARGHAYLRMQVASLGRPQAFIRSPAAETPPPSLTNQVIEITCDAFDYQEPWLTFSNEVRGRLLEGGRTLGTLECDSAALSFSSNHLQRVELDRAVRLEQLPFERPGRSRRRRALHCERLEADLLPGGYLHHIVARTNVVARQQQWRANRTNAVLSILAADLFSADFFPATNAVAHAMADGHVEARHAANAARGRRAVYTAANDRLVLQGKAELELGAGAVIRSPRFQLQPFQRWLREGQMSPLGLPVFPAHPPLAGEAAPAPAERAGAPPQG